MRTLLIQVKGGTRGGREQLSAMLAQTLHDIVGDDLEIMRLDPASAAVSLRQRLAGYIDGVTPQAERELQARMADGKFDCIFLDGSNLGRLARLVRRARTSAVVCTFYHNVETRFFFDSVRASPSVHSLGVMGANALAEFWATRHSDRRIMLNERDSRLLKRFFGKAGTDIVPMAIVDHYDPAAAHAPRPHAEPYALFVGGSFYANVEGMAWYAREIAPYAPMPTIVVGRGMDDHRQRLEQWGGVKVIGPVDELAQWYAHAHLIVAPILSGSGMKTKTAEALMHGKPIAATPEAFVGYDAAWSGQLACCETPAQFIAALKKAARGEPVFDSALRRRYEANHSENAMRNRLQAILQVHIGGGKQQKGSA